MVVTELECHRHGDGDPANADPSAATSASASATTAASADIIYRNSAGEISIVSLNGSEGKEEGERHGCLPLNHSSNSNGSGSKRREAGSAIVSRRSSEIKKASSFKRLIFMLQNSIRIFQPRLSTSASTTSLPTSPLMRRRTTVARKVYGAPLNHCIKNQEQKREQSKHVPNVVYEITQALLPHVAQEGIFRVAGSKTKTDEIVETIEKGEEVAFTVKEADDVHTLTSLLMLYFRDLPNPLLTFDLYRPFLDTQRKSTPPLSDEDKFAEIESALIKLPDPNKATLLELCKFLHEIPKHEEANKMSSRNLAICVSQEILRAREDNIMTLLQDVGQSQSLVHDLIVHIDRFKSCLKVQ